MNDSCININAIFFELLCVAIGTRKNLSITPSAEQWTELFALSKKQALVAVAFTGVTKLNGMSDYGASLGIPEMVYLKWLGLTAKIAQRNKALNEECAKVCKDFVHNGFKTVVLKGQSNLEYYPEELRECRTPGDIDVWVRPFEEIDIAVSSGDGAEYVTYHGKAAVVEYARMCARVKGVSDDLLVRYHHTDIPVSDKVDVEAHFMPMYLNNPFLNRRLQEFFEWYGEPQTPSFPQLRGMNHADEDIKTKTIKTPEEAASTCASENSNSFGSSATQSSAAIDNGDSTSSGKKQEKQPFGVFPIPSVSFNVIYQLTHIYKHLFEEGIGLRQLLDYYFVLRSWHNECADFSDRSQSMAQWAEGMGIGVLSKEEIQLWLHRLGLWRLAGAVMYVLKEVFDMPEVYMLREQDKVAGEHLLEEIMMAGNFGKYDLRKGDLSHESSAHKFWRKTKRNLLLARFYPHEALWEPPFRLYHWVWRKLELWRF